MDVCTRCLLTCTENDFPSAAKRNSNLPRSKLMLYFDDNCSIVKHYCILAIFIRFISRRGSKIKIKHFTALRLRKSNKLQKAVFSEF